ncbi:MAG: hypothetical protein L6R36_002310 [Xanthoria steineri]|nr:MAG: hypothetical protein L6R36_002310 [Xanthoria steineri]
MPNNRFSDYSLSQVDRTKLRLKHWRSLSDSDRAKVSSAAMTVLKYTGIGASIGLVAGWILARRSRSSALKIANAFKPAEQPPVVVFPNGRTENLPIISDTLKPSRFAIIATHVFYLGGTSIFGAVGGSLAGIEFADRELSGDKKTARRLKSALYRYQIDLWRTQADKLERILKDSGC